MNDTLVGAFRKIPADYDAEYRIKSLAYAFIKDAVSGEFKGFTVEEIMEACEYVLSEAKGVGE